MSFKRFAGIILHIMLIIEWFQQVSPFLKIHALWFLASTTWLVISLHSRQVCCGNANLLVSSSDIFSSELPLEHNFCSMANGGELQVRIGKWVEHSKCFHMWATYVKTDSIWENILTVFKLQIRHNIAALFTNVH